MCVGNSDVHELSNSVVYFGPDPDGGLRGLKLPLFQ